jgi:hypothetical protein
MKLIFFSLNSNPTPLAKDDQTLAINWSPISRSTTEQMPYLEITSKLELKAHPEQERMEFWDDLYEQYNGGFM